MSSLNFHSKIPLDPPGGESWAEINIDIPDIGACDENTLKFALGAMNVFEEMARPGWRAPVRAAMSTLGGQGSTGMATSRTVVTSLDPPGAHDARTDDRGRDWVTDKDGVFWIRPPGADAWYRADTYTELAGGGASGIVTGNASGTSGGGRG